MSGSIQHDKVEPNLTPILDMVFQLITFFMLVVNFKAAEVDTSIKLPVIGSALPSDSEDTDFLVLNIDKLGKVRGYGEEQNLDNFVFKEAQMALRHAQVQNPDMHMGDELPVTVVIRADRDTPFSLIDNAIRACQSRGFRKFQYRAMSALPGS